MRRPIIILALLVVGIAAVVGINALVSDNDEPANPGEQTTQEQAQSENNDEDEQESATATEYKYTAQAGDSYTEIARKAVQAYNTAKQANITEAAIVFAETNLTQAAGSPLLEIGQAVEIKETDLVAIVERAKNLTAAQAAAWSKYVRFVNFNTDKVGVAAK